MGPVAEQVVEGNDPHGGHGLVCEEIWLVSGPQLHTSVLTLLLFCGVTRDNTFTEAPYLFKIHHCIMPWIHQDLINTQ